MKHLILFLFPLLLYSQGNPPPEQYYELAVSVDQEFIDKWGPNYLSVIENMVDNVNLAYNGTTIDIEFEVIPKIQVFNVDYSSANQYVTSLTLAWENVCFDRDIIHHFTGKNLPGIHGTASGGLCECSQGDYSPATGEGSAYVSTSEHHATINWVRLAHELGHNIGLFHEDDSYCNSSNDYFMCAGSQIIQDPTSSKLSPENITQFTNNFNNGDYPCGNNPDYDSNDPEYCNFSTHTMFDDTPINLNCDNIEEIREICIVINNDNTLRSIIDLNILYNKDNIEVLEYPDFGPPQASSSSLYDTKQTINPEFDELQSFEIVVFYLKVKIKGFEYNSFRQFHVTVNVNLTMDPTSNLFTTTPAIFDGNSSEFKYLFDEPLELNITSTTDWNEKALVNGDVYVKNNSSLNISNDMTFTNSSRIIVESGSRLSIQGAELNGCNGEWGGILLEGSSGQEDLSIGNDAILKDAKTMITMDPRKLPYGSSSFGNAYINLDEVSFINCDRAVEFFSYDQVDNNSVINDCKFYDSKQGITMWNSRNITLTGNKFYDSNISCIVSMNSSFNATDNLFESNYIGVQIDNPGPTVSSNITDNIFDGTSYGLLSRGKLFGGLLVDYNRFYTPINVYTDGDSNYDLIHNLLQGDLGQVAFTNGSNANNVNLNYFSTSTSGILHVNDNTNYSFNSNCFDSGAYDVYTFGILGQQGSPAAEAGNCFTHGGTGTEIDIEPNGNSFEYYLYNDGLNNCKDCLNPGPSPSTYSTNINTLPNVGHLTCGPNIQSGYRYNYCNPRLNLDSIDIAIQYVEGQINSIQNDLSISPNIRQALLYMYKRCLKRLYARKFDLLVTDNELSLARSLYSSTVDFDEKINVFGSYIYENDYLQARSYLNSISTTQEKELDFIWTQNVLLDYIEQRSEFTISQQQSDSINNILNKAHQYSSYARSLEYLLNDSIVIPDIPTLNQARKTTGSSIYKPEMNLSNNIVSIYPNPFDNRLNIKPKEVIERIEIYNLKGQLVFRNENFSEIIELDTYDWNEGVYFIRIFDKNNIIEERNFINIRP